MSKVEHPDHYNEVPDWEVIGTIQRDLSKEEYIGFLKGNILKYRLRAGSKGDALEDIAKADYYRDLLVAVLEPSGLVFKAVRDPSSMFQPNGVFGIDTAGPNTGINNYDDNPWLEIKV